MLKYITIVIQLIAIFQLSAQSIVKAKVVDSRNKQPLAFVNIGIVGKNVGTVSDMNGHFDMIIPFELMNEVIKISMLGYEVKEYRASDFIALSNQTINLKESVYKLNDVVINADRLHSKIAGRRPKKDHTNSGFTSNQLGNEIGALIKINKSPALLDKVKFRIAWNKYDTVLFRLNLYKMENKMPGESLLKQNVYVSTSIKNGDLVVDLSELKLTVLDDFFVTLELIKNYGKSGLLFTSRKVNNDGLYYRNTSQADWNYFESFALAVEVETLLE